MRAIRFQFNDQWFTLTGEALTIVEAIMAKPGFSPDLIKGIFSFVDFTSALNSLENPELAKNAHWVMVECFREADEAQRAILSDQRKPFQLAYTAATVSSRGRLFAGSGCRGFVRA